MQQVYNVLQHWQPSAAATDYVFAADWHTKACSEILQAWIMREQIPIPAELT